VIGFSVHDTVVVFDRIRENSLIHRNVTYEKVVNHSLVQTLGRSHENAVHCNVDLLALVMFGGVTIFHFSIVLLIGIFSGTYSSIFNAAPICVVWENRNGTIGSSRRNRLIRRPPPDYFVKSIEKTSGLRKGPDVFYGRKLRPTTPRIINMIETIAKLLPVHETREFQSMQ
jgi:hypothetical protein